MNWHRNRGKFWNRPITIENLRVCVAKGNDNHIIHNILLIEVASTKTIISKNCNVGLSNNIAILLMFYCSVISYMDGTLSVPKYSIPVHTDHCVCNFLSEFT